MLAEPLTAAEDRVLQLLPTSTYLQIADTLYISRNTVKTHLRSIYQKLGVASRSEALERAVDLRLLLACGTVLRTALSKEDEQELQDALDGSQATAQ